VRCDQLGGDVVDSGQIGLVVFDQHLQAVILVLEMHASVLFIHPTFAIHMVASYAHSCGERVLLVSSTHQSWNISSAW
jgi:hypothetical protein